ncbi:MAG: SPOR domain-containing protein [Bacteroidota bacterium]
MRPIDRHIHSLLLDHDCVIIPDLGGFIASRQSAKVDTVRKVATPPRRSIAFNVYLRQNDGLLAKRLVDTEQVSYPSALQAIESYVSDCRKQMSDGRRVEIWKVGVLSVDAADNIQFEPDTTSSLCPDAFGLSILPVHVAGVAPAVTQPRRTTNRFKRKPASRTGTSQRSLVGLAAVIGALLWFSFNVYLVSRDRYGMAGMNPLDSVLPEEDIYKTTTVPSPLPGPESTAVTDTESSTTPASLQDTLVIGMEQPTRSAPVSGATSLPESTFVAGSGNYFVIAGVFSVEKNANRLIEDLKVKGFYDAGMLDRPGTKFYVSLGGFPSEAEALDYKRRISGQGIDAWVYHR